MLDLLAPIADAARLTVPEEHRRPIGIVGAGAIVEHAHLPAYQDGGLPVAGIFDRDSARAATISERFGVRAYDSLEELLGDDEVEVVDIAVPPQHQPGLATAALEAGKHLLCQKPLALTPDEAAEIVEAAARAGRLVAVNQQLRFEEGIRATRAMLERGWVGEVSAVTFTVNVKTDWGQWPWLVTAPRLEIQFHSIHYLDAIRSLIGDPVRVFSALGRTAGQEAVGETRSMSTLLYADGARALVHANHENAGGDSVAEFRVDGSRGAIRGTLGLMYDYPSGRPDTVEVRSDIAPTDGWLPYPVTKRWLPDAFLGPIGSLLRAIADGGRPETDAHDNVHLVRLLDGLYRSAETGEAVALDG